MRLLTAQACGSPQRATHRKNWEPLVLGPAHSGKACRAGHQRLMANMQATRQLGAPCTRTRAMGPRAGGVQLCDAR